MFFEVLVGVGQMCACVMLIVEEIFLVMLIISVRGVNVELPGIVEYGQVVIVFAIWLQAWF